MYKEVCVKHESMAFATNSCSPDTYVETACSYMEVEYDVFSSTSQYASKIPKCNEPVSITP